MKILIASDHAGFSLKEKIVKVLSSDFSFIDLGPQNEDRVDYPDYADKLIQQMKETTVGILICGSGQGMAMRANKYSSIRAALCWSIESAQLARQHNDANVLCLGARLIEPPLAFDIIKTFLNTPFEGGRHSDRVRKMSQPAVKK